MSQVPSKIDQDMCPSRNSMKEGLEHGDVGVGVDGDGDEP
jgi:hypothetical protein